jgi:hypothetical protein
VLLKPHYIWKSLTIFVKGATTLSITTFNVATFSITIRKCVTQQNDTYAERHNAEWLVLRVTIKSIMLSVVMLNAEALCCRLKQYKFMIKNRYRNRFQYSFDPAHAYTLFLLELESEWSWFTFTYLRCELNIFCQLFKEQIL